MKARLNGSYLLVNQEVIYQIWRYVLEHLLICKNEHQYVVLQFSFFSKQVH